MFYFFVCCKCMHLNNVRKLLTTAHEHNITSYALNIVVFYFNFSFEIYLPVSHQTFSHQTAKFNLSQLILWQIIFSFVKVLLDAVLMRSIDKSLWVNISQVFLVQFCSTSIVPFDFCLFYWCSHWLGNSTWAQNAIWQNLSC